ncbi:hypothetical protein FACS1894206_00160 [Deltaproteobacteria bacterium]|nr:hypothetical protein FACS1894206_00160 [Deltaproteobacteria bacterium]
MSNDTNNSLVSLGGLSEPANTLIKKVSKAIGGLCEPWQIKRVTKAKAEAAIREAQTAIQITDLQRRAAQRWLEEEAKKQKNIEDITVQAIPHLKEDTNAENMDDDWIMNFFDKSRIISNTEMQSLWARVLAGEANNPGTYSKRTVNLLGGLDKSDAELFTKLCGFCWVVGDTVPLVFDVKSEIYRIHGIHFETLGHLASIGLVQFEPLTNFKRIGFPKKIRVYYYENLLELNLPKDDKNELTIGHIMFTKIGRELAPICGSQPVDGFVEYVKEKWKMYHPEILKAASFKR